MSIRYFPKPQPFSPKTKTWLEGGLATIGRKRIDYMSDEHIREAMLNEGYVKTFEQITKTHWVNRLYGD